MILDVRQSYQNTADTCLVMFASFRSHKDKQLTMAGKLDAGPNYNDTYEVSYEDQKNSVIEKTQFGGQVLFQVANNDDELCKEFTVSSPRFCFGKWMLWTTIFNSLGYLMGLHSQVINCYMGLSHSTHRGRLGVDLCDIMLLYSAAHAENPCL